MKGRRFAAVVGTTLMASTLLCQAEPIHEAAKRGDQSEINRIVASRPDALESRDAAHGNTPLHWAAYKGHYEVARTLLKNGANPNSRTRDGYTPLRDAAYRGNTKIVQLLLDSGARVDSPDNRGATPLHWAGHGGRTASAKLLLKAQASVTREDEFGSTPIEWAREAGNFQCAKVMRRALWQPLSKALWEDDREALAALLKRYPGAANLEIGIYEGSPYPPSRPICEAQNLAQLEMLLEAGADPLAEIYPVSDSSFIQTPLHALKPEFLDRVLREGFDPDSVGELDITPLSKAVWHNQLESVEVLLRNGADPNRSNTNGNTSLHVAADETGRFLGRRDIGDERHVELAKALVQAGADPMLRNSQGLTAEELARKHGHEALTAYLRGLR